MNKAAFAVDVLRRYANERKIIVRSTSDLSQLEEWLMMELYKITVNTPEPEEWISVKDRLPEKYTDVLFVSEVGDVYMGHYMYSVEDEWRWSAPPYTFKISYITHWMPLPQIPKL